MKRKSKASSYIIRGGAFAILLLSALVTLTSAFNPPTRWTKSGVPVRSSGKAPTASHQTRRLTFADRVAYQRAIEEVYWRHRIWPKERPDPKPSLDAVMSQAQLEKKVEDYLRDSQALEDYWQKPITPEQLQAEMERMAQHTKQPEMLRELFGALGDDPLVIAECLARPALAERLVTNLYAHDERFHDQLKQRAEAELKTHGSVREIKQTSGTYTEMEWIKSEDAKDGSAPGDQKSAQAVKMNSTEWQENVAKLAAQFDKGSLVGAIDLNRPGGSGEPPLPEKSTRIVQIKTGVLSPLQEDDVHYYAVAVMEKGKDRLKLATIAWLKEPLRSWLAKAEAQAPVTMAAVSSVNYTLPVIASPADNSSPSIASTDDTWTPTSTTNAPTGRHASTFRATSGRQAPQPDISFIFTTIDVPGATNTLAGGVNNFGHIVGYHAQTNGIFHGFLDVGGMFSVIDDPNAISGTGASDINGSDQIVGSYNFTDPNHPLEGAHGFLLSGGVFTAIDYPAPGVSSTTPVGVNGLGDVVGLYRMNSPGVGFLLSGGTYTSITFPGGCCTNANGINDTGEIVGQYKTPE